jgi:hypothetical protein
LNKSKLFFSCVLVSASALLLQSTSVFAVDGVPMKHRMMNVSEQDFDWIKHTEHTLGELKAKLNLTSEQMPAWDTWSRGVLQDAHQQLDQKKLEQTEKQVNVKNAMDETTPEKMENGIARLREETNWMQAHLVQLEAALARTKTFYAGLNTNQKTIFDLFWHEMHHRMSGHDQGMKMHGQDGDNCEMTERS